MPSRLRRRAARRGARPPAAGVRPRRVAALRRRARRRDRRPVRRRRLRRGARTAPRRRPFGSALPLRFLGAVHRLVLEGEGAGAGAATTRRPAAAPGPDPGRRLPRRRSPTTADEIERRHRPTRCRPTRSAGRRRSSAATPTVARRTGLPLRVLEVGASAGLNLRWDHYWYDTGDVDARRPGQPGALRGRLGGRAAPGLADVAVARGRAARAATAARSTSPPTTGAPRLRSYVWPDQVERLAPARGGVRRWPRRVPAAVERADAGRVGRRRGWPSPSRAWPRSSPTRSCWQYVAARVAGPAAGRAGGGGRGGPRPTRRWPGCGWSPPAPVADLRLTLVARAARSRCSPPPGTTARRSTGVRRRADEVRAVDRGRLVGRPRAPGVEASAPTARVAASDSADSRRPGRAGRRAPSIQ